ncbi:hypothetical protein [Wenzhouxiangella sp. XN201]|uniref:hypothetical protein n=1 Tax=Wenzhouxiangella sp. XN201 TaxID=2710755 RepID=UPI001969FFBF|nr:hypothetical protein [Wenzhouxiangella sp. XN201]
MMDFKIGEVLGLMAKTMPFLIFRFLIYFGITLAYVLVTGVGAGIGYFVGHIGDDPGAFSVWGGLVGFGITSAILYFLREYLLYMVKAGHIAVLVELLEGRELPEGRGQIDYAQGIVRERFVESSVLFGIDQLIKAVLKAFNRAFFTITAFIPIPGLQGVVKFINTVVNLSLTYLDEVILAHNMRTKSDNPWRSGQTALILYAQNYKTFLKNAFWLAFFIWAMTFLVFLVVLLPVAGLVSLFPGTAGILTLVIALVFAWGIKQAVIEPIGMTALMQVYFKVTEGQEPNPEWDDKLSSVSKKFGEMKTKAMDWDREKGTKPQASDEPTPGGAAQPEQS